MFPGSDGGRGIYGRHDHNLPDVLLDRTGINSIQTLAAMTNSDLLTLQKPLLTFMYAYYGIIQETIDRPIDDAFKHGIQLKIQSSPLDEVVFDTDDFMSYLEDMHVIRIVKDAMRYARLYGGAAIIITTNDTLPSEPLDVRTFKQDTKIKLYPVDRWELSWYGDVSFEYRPKKYDSRYIQVDSIYDPEYYIFRHNVVHKSRV
ncbi:MAG: DUF1073 domain-containing protein, partial [Mycoplasma sp.]|nr:DUF1073 domain-containing protein [Mycoplasma sp.]